MELKVGKISVLIPYKKQNDSHRELLWANIKQRYKILMPELEICMGLDDSAIYNRARAINNAAKQATGNVFILTDADVVFSTEIINRILPIMNDHPWIVPFTNGYKLTQAATERLISEGLPNSISIGQSDVEISFNFPGTFISVVTRENFFKVRGMDERFEGWGGEDDAFRYTLETLCGKHFRLPGEVFHLWHKPAEINNEYHDKNLKLLQRYYAAQDDKAAMMDLVNEKKALDDYKNSETAEVMLDWWNKNLKDGNVMKVFKGWIGTFDAISKKFTRNYIEAMKYKSLLDCGCGCCTEYFGYINDGYSIKYTGVDTCNLLIEENERNGIDVKLSSSEKLPFSDNSYEVVYIRHLLEHLPGYEKALDEAIRVAGNEVLVIFFLRPGNAIEKINYDEKENLYNNEYNKQEIEDYIKTKTKVNRFRWENIANEAILHIYVDKPKMIIPRVFHRIWMGDAPMPAEFIEYGKTWAKFHPDWEIKLWNEKNIFPLKNQKLFDNANHPVQKCEIARLEILYNLGGVYLDCDFECLKNIEDLISGFDGFTASEAQGIFSMGIMGAVPGHEVFGMLSDGLEESINKYRNYTLNYQAGPLYATRKIRDYPYFTMFGPRLFYPYAFEEKYRKGESFPEAYAVHHWANAANL